MKLKLAIISLFISLNAFSQSLDDLFDDGGKSIRNIGVGIDPMHMALLNIYSIYGEYLFTDNFRVLAGVGVWRPKNRKDKVGYNQEWLDGGSGGWIDVEYKESFKFMFQSGIHYIKPFYIRDSEMGFIMGVFFRHRKQDYYPNVNYPYTQKVSNGYGAVIGWQFLRSRVIEVNYTFGAGPQNYKLKKSTQFLNEPTLKAINYVEFEGSLRVLYKF